MLAELRDQFLPDFVVAARARIKQALALLPPVGPGGDESATAIDKLMHTTAGEASMIGLGDVADAARAAQAAAKRCLSTQGGTTLSLIGCARALRSLARLIDVLKPAAPSVDRSANAPTLSGAPEAPGRVMLVDDSPLNAVVLCTALEAKGVQATAVKDDLQQALSQLATFHPHVVLIDAIMPNLDPKKLCEQIRANPANAGIQLLLYTALSEEEAAAQVQALGVDGFVTKDLGSDAIVDRVRALLPGARS